MKKALIVTRVSGFVPQFEMNNVKILQEMGYEVHYAANYDTVVYGKDNSRLDGTGIIQHHIPFTRSPFSKDVRMCTSALADLMYDIDFDLIHCHMPMTGILARRAAEKVAILTSKRVPVLYTCHGFHFFSGSPLKNWLYYIPERYYSRCTDGLILINDEDYNRAKRWPVRGKVYKIPGVGMRLDEDSSENQENEYDVRKEFGIPSDHRILVSVGELNEGKNHAEMIKAMTNFKDMPITYIICGEGVLHEQLQSLAKSLGVDKQVILTGYTPYVKEILKQAYIFIHPSKREGLPVAVMEAMCAGLPVIAADIRGNRDLIEDGEGGLLLPVNYSESYAERIRMLLETPELCARMGAWNRERIKDFSLEKVEAKMRMIYKEQEWSDEDGE